MKKISSLIIAQFALSIIFFTGCNMADSTNTGAPKEALKSFFEHIAKKDFDGAGKYATKASKPSLNMIASAINLAETMKTQVPQDVDYAKEMADATIGDAVIKGDSAFVSVSSKTNKRPPADIILLKEDGQWKVDFSMSALTKMGQQSMKNNGLPHDTSMVNSEKMEEAMKAADSLMKHMDPKKLDELKKSVEQMKEQIHQ